MTDDPEVDVDRLRTELDQIKGAMGLEERYPGRIRYWLVYGALVPLAAAVSQYVALADLPGYYHALAWAGLLSLGGAFAWLRSDDHPAESTGGKPSIPLVFAAVLSYYVVAVSVLGQVDSLDPSVESAMVFAMVVGLVGVAYLVVGNALRAYYIRRRDRFALYVGGAWMVVLAALIPVVEPLRTWGYAVFGVAFGLHSFASYLLLSRSD